MSDKSIHLTLEIQKSGFVCPDCGGQMAFNGNETIYYTCTCNLERFKMPELTQDEKDQLEELYQDNEISQELYDKLGCLL